MSKRNSNTFKWNDKRNRSDKQARLTTLVLSGLPPVGGIKFVDLYTSVEKDLKELYPNLNNEKLRLRAYEAMQNLVDAGKAKRSGNTYTVIGEEQNVEQPQ